MKFVSFFHNSRCDTHVCKHGTILNDSGGILGHKDLLTK